MQFSAQQVIETINGWDDTTTAHFHRLVSVNVTISIRVLLEDENLPEAKKLNELRWLNEFHHRLLSWWRNADGEWQSAEKLFSLLQFYAGKMERRGAVEFPVASAFKTVQGLRAEEE